jgi:hypothetical protein
VPETAGHVRDVATYITKLPKAEHDADEWQAAMEALLLVVEHGGPPRCTIATARRVRKALTGFERGSLWPMYLGRPEGLQLGERM